MRMLQICLLVGCVACASTEPATDTAPATTDPTPPEPTFEPATAEVVTLETRDDVTLEADLYVGQPGYPAFVLLHMTPEGPWSRADWPSDFIDRLTGHGWSVIAIDRRGAGASGGVAADAFGEPGKYDVEAAVGALVDAGVGAIALIGASNGTTAMVDYAIWAPSEGLPEIAAMGFMTGGTYTENQNPMSAAPAVPAIFTYSTAEKDWSVDQQPLDPGGWAFEEYPGGDHGTLMFDAKPGVKGDLEAFFAETFGS